MSTLPGLGGGPPNSQWTPPANRQARRVNKAATLAALRASKRSGPVAPSTPTTEDARDTINATLLGTAQALKRGLPGVDFLVIGLRAGGDGRAEVFLKSTMPPGSEATTAEVLEGMARYFRGQTPAAPPETPGAQ